MVFETLGLEHCASTRGLSTVRLWGVCVYVSHVDSGSAGGGLTVATENGDEVVQRVEEHRFGRIERVRHREKPCIDFAGDSQLVTPTD